MVQDESRDRIGRAYDLDAYTTLKRRGCIGHVRSRRTLEIQAVPQKGPDIIAERRGIFMTASRLTERHMLPASVGDWIQAADTYCHVNVLDSHPSSLILIGQRSY